MNFTFLKKHKLALISLASVGLMAADCVMSVDKITFPENAQVNSEIEITVEIKLIPSSDEVSPMAFAVLAPTSWNLKENASLTLSTSGYASQGFAEVVDEPLTLIPDTELEFATQLPYPVAYQSRVGNMGNTGPVEWTVYKSSTNFNINNNVSSDPIIGTVKIKLTTGPDNIKFYMGFGYCGTERGLQTEEEASGDFRYVPNERAEVFEVTGGDGIFYDYTATPPISTTPSTFRYGDIFAINFEASGQELEGTEEVYLCAKYVLADGTEGTMEDKVDKSLMEKSGETSYFRYIYPYDFFGLPVGTEIKEIYVWCSNADGSVLYKEGEDGTLVSQAEQ